MYCWVLSWYCVYFCKHLVSTNSTLRKPAVYCNHSQLMLYQQSCTAHNGTANCTVGHAWEALLLLGQNAFNANAVEKTSLPFPMTHGVQTKYIVCANFSSTQVIHKKYQIIKQFFAQDICGPFTLPYVHKYMFH